MNKTQSTRTFIVNVVDTNSQWHTLRIERNDHRGLKAEARKIAKAQGFEVRYLNDFYIAA